MTFSKARCDDEDEREAMRECSTRYKHLRKQFMETKSSVSKAVAKQVAPVLPVNVEVVEDQADLIQDELQATTYSRLVIEEEVGLLEQGIASLPRNLSREVVTNQRVRPDRLAAEMEGRMKPHLQNQISLEPGRREELQRNHHTFIKGQAAGFTKILSTLFEKQVMAPADAPVSISSQQARPPPRLQLEKLKVPTFDGDHTKWLPFKTRFEDLVVT